MDNEMELVEKAKTGDAEAFAQLYEQIYKPLYRCALYTLKNPEDAEDAVSETVMAAFASISKLREREAFKSWMFRILSNICRKKMREYAARRTETPVQAYTDTVSEKSHEEDILIRQLFFELEETERMIISLHLFGGYKGREIAQMLQMNENTVRSKESRGLKKLAEKWR